MKIVVTAVGSPSAIKGRTFTCTFDLPKGEKKPAPSKQCPNPIVLAQEWQRRLDAGEAASRADLARKLGVSRAHVTQVLRLLTMAPQVKATVLALGDPIEGRSIGIHTLRPLCNLSAKEQLRKLKEILSSAEAA